ncbi:MAG: M23 family metallopeptidase [Clostridium sp.]|nr:M23 family metallopeptidase [Prevotella sp.]MCM1428167.1 M23 family metallopeptidase [Clostridium sp.]MCM1474698.1 M23 family metallopeptidase [Muribaculaceae bacterium]
MKQRARKDYWLSLDDESRLERVGHMRLTLSRLILGGLIFLAVSILLGSIIVLTTPLKALLPGYLKENERTLGEEALMRLDSLRTVSARNEQYLKNLQTVLDIRRSPRADSLEMARKANHLTADSLLPTSREERDFVKRMREKEKYNVSVLAPLAADGLIFYPVNGEGIVASASRDSYRSEIVIPRGGTVSAIADGSVLSVVRSGQLSTVIIQHPRGFVSRYSGMAMVVIDEGDMVYGGQALGHSPSGGKSSVGLELWHEGTRLKPYEYLTTRMGRQPHQESSGIDDNQPGMRK